MARIASVNISTEKGVVKIPVPEAEANGSGLRGDAHAGPWHRQVSLLSKESIDGFGKQAGRSFACGAFAENLTTEGLDFSALALFDRLDAGEAELEITQFGKACHGEGCAIFKQAGRCVMPKDGVFARVLKGGRIRPGDPLVHRARPLRVRIITLSDRASRGEYSDRSGPAVQEGLETRFKDCRWHLDISRLILPDDEAGLREALAGDINSGTEIVFTTGGTGIGPRDITPDVVVPMLDKLLPGVMEFVRMKHGERLPASLLSRSVAGTAKSTLVFTLPGSEKAVKEYLEAILPLVEHALLMMRGIDAH